MTQRIHALVVGAGPAGLATALRLKQKLNRAKRSESVVVLDKAARLGYHTLSGAVLEAECLDELVPGWRRSDDAFVQSMVKIERDELYYLGARTAAKLPALVVPPSMKHLGDHAVSLGRMVDWLGRLAKAEGVEIYSGFAASRLLVEGGRVQGVKLVDLGLNREGRPKSNYLAGEEVLADVTIVSDGSRGVLSNQFVERFGKGKNPQVYSVGVKQLLKLPPGNAFGAARAVHMLGYPNPGSVFGGGFLYSMGDDVVALGLILGLDWQYQDLSPQKELELLKAHPFVARLIEGGQVLISGVKTIPEGGYYAVPRLYASGALLVGDAAGFVNMEKIKGIHYAIRSGMAAADAVYEALARGDCSEVTLAGYQRNLEARKVLDELYHARNFRQSFKLGRLAGAALSNVQSWLPARLRMEEDYRAMKPGAKIDRPDKVGMDRAQFVSFSGVAHREDEPPHIKIKDAAACVECTERFGNPCMYFCPGEVYHMKGTEMILSPSNCLHDASCQVKCPLQNVVWTPPEGGEGPRFKQM